MPYSQKHNVLFIHIPKCAGKSFEVALGIVSKEEAIKYKWRSFFNRAGKFILNKTRDRKAFHRIWGIWDMTLTLQHLTYTEIELLDILDQKTLNNSIKVAIVRNPFDRAVSSYKHMGKEYGSFKDFIEIYYAEQAINHNDLAHKRPQIDFIRSKDGGIAVDNIIRYESLEKDYSAFLAKHNISTGTIPHIGKQKKDGDYKKYYSSETKEKVGQIFYSDLEHLNYSFD